MGLTSGPVVGPTSVTIGFANAEAIHKANRSLGNLPADFDPVAAVRNSIRFIAPS
jgi:hypothetical protein